MLLRSLQLGALFLCAGCYTYVPSPGRLLPDREVQLALTDSGTVVLAPLVGPSIGTVDGRFIRDSADTYLLAVTRTARRDGTDMDWRGERLVVPRVLVSTAATRRFSPGRTIMFGALATGALVGIAEAFVGGGGASVPGGSPTGTPVGR
jgi:hypothetical protein